MLEHSVSYKEIRSSATEILVTERFKTLDCAQWAWDQLDREARIGKYPRVELITPRPGSDLDLHSRFLLRANSNRGA